MRKQRYKIVFVIVLLLSQVLSILFVCQKSYAQNATIAVSATDIDLGDYKSTMTIGEEQHLSVTVLPLTVTDDTCTYKSENTEVASINGMGSITALAEGTTYISVNCGTVTSGFQLTVTKEQDQSDMTQKVSATGIEVSDYKDELYVDKTLSLSATVLPSDTTESQVTYSSDNEAIATVSSTGVVKGISAGDVTIRLQAGDVVKDIVLHVKVSTVQIQMNCNYLILKKGDSYTLSGKAIPENADQTLTYKSSDESIAAVNDNGTVTAKNIGSATVIVTNGDLSCAVSVIVNEEVGQSTVADVEQDILGETSQSGIVETLLEKLQVNEQVLCEQQQLTHVSSSLLKFLYENQKTIQLENNNYTLTIHGSDIVNYNNEFNTELNIRKNDNGIEFEINEGDNLPGIIYLDLNEERNAANAKLRYLYKYNDAKGKYEKLKYSSGDEICIDVTGKYQLTSHELHAFSINWLIAAIVIGIIIILIGIYIVVKKRYWFW